MLAGTPAAFQEGMKRIAATIPNGKARLELLPGLGHVPFMEAPERALQSRSAPSWSVPFQARAQRAPPPHKEMGSPGGIVLKWRCLGEYD
jgi:hypothetical protein